MSDNPAGWVFEWRNRDNSDSRLVLSPKRTREEARKIANALGWPGHSGSRWGYFKDDLLAWWRVFQ